MMTRESKKTISAAPETTNDYRRDFPESFIRDQARDLFIIAEAHTIDLGGNEGAVARLRHAMAIAQRLADLCAETAKNWGLVLQDAP
jgi:hypothetical protein